MAGGVGMATIKWKSREEIEQEKVRSQKQKELRECDKELREQATEWAIEQVSRGNSNLSKLVSQRNKLRQELGSDRREE